jgi:predicted nucleic acid-binding protein
MNEIAFVDTNVLVYARDSRYPRQQSVAAVNLRNLWLHRSGRTSAQVLSEYYVTMTCKLSPGLAADDAWDDVQAFLSWNPQPIDAEVLTRAREIERRYQTNWWDAAIVAAAQLQGCNILLSEDFQHGMTFGAVTVRNPFASTVSEANASYSAGASTSLARPLHPPRGRPARRA